MTAPLLVIGNANVDLIMGPQAPWPVPGTEVLLPDGDLRAGGAAGNTALALAGLGAPHRLIANRGRDVFGDWLAGALPDGERLAVTAVATTVSVGITHPDGERTFFTTDGHLGHFDLACVEAQLPPAAGPPGGLALLSGIFVTPRLLPDYRALMARLGQRGLGLALDTGWPSGGWTPEVRRTVRDWLPHCAHLLLNEAEVRGLAGLEDTAAAVAALRADLPARAVLVVKRGAAGALVLRAGEATAVPAPTVAVVDTIGAGDALNAGYLAAIRDGASPERATAAGVGLATLAVSTRPRRYA